MQIPHLIALFALPHFLSSKSPLSFYNLFCILLVDVASPPQRKKAKLFLDKNVICLLQNGKFNHTNDCTNDCGGWFSISNVVSLRTRCSSAAVMHYYGGWKPTHQSRQRTPKAAALSLQQITSGCEILIDKSSQQSRLYLGSLQHHTWSIGQRHKIGMATCCVVWGQIKPSPNCDILCEVKA